MSDVIYTKEQIRDVALSVARLIKDRSPDLDQDKLKDEVVTYTQFIFNEALTSDRNNKKEKPDPYNEITALKDAIINTMDKITGLSPEADLSLWLTTQLSESGYLDISFQDKAVGALDDLLIAINNSNLKPTGKGRPEQQEKAHFIEAVLQVFERATGMTITDIDKLPIQESRTFKTKLYELVDLSAFNPHLFFTSESTRKFIRDYLKDRKHYDFVLDSFEHHLKP
tara:strand:+ start:1718 stop:2395 length:678 start_codon:yes stop_codon:yes gene_type:complete